MVREMCALIEFKNIIKSYTMGDITIHASDGVNFEVNKGEFVVIVGASGAGKTTILNLLGGMDSPTDVYKRQSFICKTDFNAKSRGIRGFIFI